MEGKKREAYKGTGEHQDQFWKTSTQVPSRKSLRVGF